MSPLMCATYICFSVFKRSKDNCRLVREEGEMKDKFVLIRGHSFMVAHHTTDVLPWRQYCTVNENEKFIKASN